jgi:hypothetical protein
VRGLGKRTNSFKITEELNNYLLQRVHRAEDPNNQRLFEKFAARSACRDPFRSLYFTRKISEGIEPLKCSKGGGGRNRLTEVKFKRKDAKSFG